MYHLFPFPPHFLKHWSKCSSTVFGFSGTNKEDFIDIICNTREFYEGTIHWSYLTLLARTPTTQETDFLMNDFFNTCDFLKLQRYIMKTDEYAQF